MKDLKAEALFHLKLIDIFRHCYFKKSFCETGIYHGQFPLLKYISEHDGCGQIEMSKQFNISPAAVAKSLTRLEKAEFITKKQDNDNKRANLIYLTEKGKKALDDNRAHFAAFDEKLFQDFSGEEITEFKRMVDKMLINLSEESEINDEKLRDVVEKLMEEQNHGK